MDLKVTYLNGMRCSSDYSNSSMTPQYTNHKNKLVRRLFHEDCSPKNLKKNENFPSPNFPISDASSQVSLIKMDDLMSGYSNGFNKQLSKFEIDQDVSLGLLTFKKSSSEKMSNFDSNGVTRTQNHPKTCKNGLDTAQIDFQTNEVSFVESNDTKSTLENVKNLTLEVITLDQKNKENDQKKDNQLPQDVIDKYRHLMDKRKQKKILETASKWKNPSSKKSEYKNFKMLELLNKANQTLKEIKTRTNQTVNNL